ncbi:MAG: pilus assembly protein TadG-related protein [Anaerolineae bacterium]
MKRHGLQNQRGSVLVFTTLLLVFLIGMGGLAIDLSYLSAARGELQRSMDAAALAGAGNLGFDDTVFPTVRQEAWRFGNLNPYRVGAVNLNLNAANAANGDIVLGIWDGSANTFTPSLDGTQVNAVQCQFATQIPTAFTRVLGFATLPVSAQAIAVANPPQILPPETCVFPIALSDCLFDDGGVYSSQGCGAPVTLISSSGGPPGPPPGGNTAGWADTCSTGTPSVPDTLAAIQAAASQDQSCNSCIPTAGESQVGTTNGMQQPVFNALEDAFVDQWNNGETYVVTDSNGDPTYNGPGWKVYVPVIDTACPPQAITGAHDVNGWTEFVMTQVVNNGTCAVNNPYDPQLASLGCPDTGEPALRAVFGYYSCTVVESPPVDEPGPRSALADRMRLVQ